MTRTISLVLVCLASAALAGPSSPMILPTPKSVAPAKGSFAISAKADVTTLAKASIDKTLAAEAYTLAITPKAITITGGSDAGIFWAKQSLLQLVETNKTGKRSVAFQTITDEPTYRWRSFMLDSGRQMK